MRFCIGQAVWLLWFYRGSPVARIESAIWFLQEEIKYLQEYSLNATQSFPRFTKLDRTKIDNMLVQKFTGNVYEVLVVLCQDVVTLSTLERLIETLTKERDRLKLFIP